MAKEPIKERTFRPKIKMNGALRVKTFNAGNKSAFTQAVMKEKQKARIKKFNKTHPDYKPPIHGKK